ncbi:MAG: hypothetical protein J7M12_00260 [Candidatus Hydrogenedentes bacterium]|nr:hypothetical protein [Candidatus Hydrogenedentota bacterium]
MYRRVRCGKDRGVALMLALGVLAVMVILAAASIKFMNISADMTDYKLDLMRARYAARGGIEVARVRISERPDAAAGQISGQAGDGFYTVTLKKTSDGYEVDAEGKYSRNNGSEVTSRIVAKLKPTAKGVRVGMWQE